MQTVRASANLGAENGAGRGFSAATHGSVKLLAFSCHSGRARIVGNKRSCVRSRSMRALLLAAAGVLAVWSVPAEASHWHFGPYVGFGYGLYGPYPYYSPWYGPRVGVAIQTPPRYQRRNTRATQAQQEQRALKLYVYPAAGQSEAQTADDRYQCHLWAADQSGHDPTLGAGSRADAEDYTRAFTACMEGRNYVVK
jgi:hypothetical protein